MSEMQSNSNPNDFDNEIELREIFSLLWQKKWIIISITTFAAITGVIVSLLLPNIYESKICPLGNISAFALALWVFMRDLFLHKTSLRKDLRNINLFIFSIVLVLSFVMNLNAFIYFIPVFIYEFKLI